MGSTCCRQGEKEPVEGEKEAASEPVAGLSTDEEVPAAEEAPVEAEPIPKFTVALVGARGLRNADWLPGTGKSDSYLELKTKDKVHHTTAVINDCLDPLWHEECKIMELEDDAELEFYVYDKDMVTSTKLGHVTLKSEDFKNGYNGELELEDTGKKAGDKAYLRIKVKAGDGDFPAGPPPEVTVTVDRASKDKSWGLDLDLQDGVFLYVKSVTDGTPFKEYNASKPAAEQVVPGDYIAKVNDKTGDNKEMLLAIKEETKVTLQVHRNYTQTIIIEKNDEKQPLGLKLPSKPVCDFLAIRGIEEPGAFAEHNSNAKEEMKIYTGDRIVMVNGAKGKATDLQAKLKQQSGKFQIVVERPDGTEGAAKWRNQ